MPMPTGYVDDMIAGADCIEGQGDERILIFDTQSDAYRKLKEKYRKPKGASRRHGVQSRSADAAPVEAPRPLRKRPAWTFENLASVTKALLAGGTGVSPERREKRLEICSKCEMVQFDGKTMRCGVCGCKLRRSSALVDLLRYEETASYGCKHPKGSRWKAAGV